MGTPAKERYCALCGTAKTSGGRKYCTACLKVVRKKNAEEHNKKMAAYYAAKKKQPCLRAAVSAMYVPEHMLPAAPTASRWNMNAGRRS